MFLFFALACERIFVKCIAFKVDVLYRTWGRKKKKFADASVHPGNFTGWVSVGIKMLFCAA